MLSSDFRQAFNHYLASDNVDSLFNLFVITLDYSIDTLHITPEISITDVFSGDYCDLDRQDLMLAYRELNEFKSVDNFLFVLIMFMRNYGWTFKDFTERVKQL